ncbi:Class II Aminoacyl-tRNA synthetase/Biotinyl protein ligase (BPL) and lipoyl protein ligase (LPL) [Abortiporus biennis]
MSCVGCSRAITVRANLAQPQRLIARCISSKPDVSLSTSLPPPRLNYRDISENVVFKSHNAFNRKAPLPIGAIQNIARLYDDKRAIASTLNSKRHERSAIGDRIRLLAKDPISKQAVLEEAKTLKAEISGLETKLEELESQLFHLAIAIPNDTHPSVPIGPESVAVITSTHGPEPVPSTPQRDHVNIGRTLGLLDLESGAVVTGSSWYYLLEEGALLEMALTNYALSIAMKHGFKPVTTPDVVRTDVAYRCGFQPRDAQSDQMYHVSTSSSSSSTTSTSSNGQQPPSLVLTGTAEIPLAGMFANKIYHLEELPKKVVGLGRAFRAEAGARGADTRGLYRVHQFTKLELFTVTEEGKSEEMMEELKSIQVEIFEGLGFPFRILDMPTEELGASAYRKYDIEAWMPGRGSWGEISSTSNCTDYQARRLHIRYRRSAPGSSSPSPTPSTTTTTSAESSALPFAHTLNGTAAAVPRLIVALIENGARFNEDGVVVGLDLPSVLKSFWVDTRERSIVRWV